jgi:valyl-tRNA synthetase
MTADTPAQTSPETEPERDAADAPFARFDPVEAEPRLYAAWETSGAFQPQGKGAPYAIVIPPPNVTGVLHMGHALNNTLQDALARFARMQGKRVLWQPGTDHAGIATQMVVERQLTQAGNIGRREMGREAFLKRVWAWKEESGGAITQQLKRLGASCDWSRDTFTMGKDGSPDDQMVQAVIKVFVDLYNQKLIYRDKRLVNWDPHFQTAISDLEVENREVKGHMWHFRYPLAGGETYRHVEKDADGNVVVDEERNYISIATTRPETMLGDGAVAVHPSDERYKPIIGKLCEIPVGPKKHRRLIPIIVDEYPDPTFGSGAVKITGAHDFNDYQVAKRNGIPLYRLMDETATMRADGAPYAEAARRALEIARGAQASAAEVDALNLVPDEYRGLKREAARMKVVKDIEADGLLDRIEDKTIMQPFGDRSNVVIEPMLTDQWYVDAKTLAKPAIEAVESGRTRFVPEAWTKTYYEWMRNIEPWCVSRQLWWGHRIPAWYGPDSKIFVAFDEAGARAQARLHFGRDVELKQDEDVLDTWFSSALWPFSTMGWPGETSELKEFYPTAVLVTGFDIIFFWVARMMMQGLHFMGEVPFKDVYIHALVRDEKGQKMSKSKGNVMDPLDIIDGVDVETLVRKRTTGLMNPNDAPRIEKDTRKDYPTGIPAYGADALRFTLAALATQGRDIKLSLKTVEGYRNFSTKLWSAARFAEMNGCRLDPGFDPKAAKTPLARWIIAETAKAAAEVTAGLEGYRFNEAAGAIYRFTWNIFCDWYLELSKPVLMGDDATTKAEVRAATAWTIDQIVRLLHPFMPFVTEELFQKLDSSRGMLITAAWPKLEGLEAPDAEAEVNWVVDLVSAIRSARSDLNVPAGARAPMTLVGGGAETKARLETWGALIERLARLEKVKAAKSAPKGTIRVVAGEATACLDVAALIDLSAETARLRKEIARHEADIAGIEKKLANEQFISKAPPEVVEEQHERRAAADAARKKLSAALKQLEGEG